MCQRQSGMSQGPVRFFPALLLILSLTACATLQAPSNGPLPAGKGFTAADVSYRIGGSPSREPNSDELLVIMTLSGGGKRSAAYAYGVMKALNSVKIGKRTLLQEVDIISGVSGGVFAASYYTLHQQETFIPRETGCGFERDFLYTDFADEMIGMHLLPWRWGWMFDGSFGRSDAMAHVYANALFRNGEVPAGAEPGCRSAREDRPYGAKYADVSGRPPLLIVGATDVAKGSFFTFTQDSFDPLCSDLSAYPLAWAVAASNAFPVLFSGVTLTSYRAANGSCGSDPTWKQVDPSDKVRCDPRRPIEQPSPRFGPEAAVQETRRDYMDPCKTHFVHLQDGGIGDNLALRGLINFSLLNRQASDLGGMEKARKILLIMVDGQSIADPSLALKPSAPGALPVLGAVLDTTIDRYNADTLQVALEELERLENKITTLRCDPTKEHAPDCSRSEVESEQHPHVYFARLRLAEDGNFERRKEIERTETGLGMLDNKIDLIVEAGVDAVACARPTGVDPARNQDENPDLADFIADVRGDTAALRPSSCAKP